MPQMSRKLVPGIAVPAIYFSGTLAAVFLILDKVLINDDKESTSRCYQISDVSAIVPCWIKWEVCKSETCNIRRLYGLVHFL